MMGARSLTVIAKSTRVEEMEVAFDGSQRTVAQNFLALNIQNDC